MLQIVDKIKAVERFFDSLKKPIPSWNRFFVDFSSLKFTVERYALF
jgi:hypothetical protein